MRIFGAFLLLIFSFNSFANDFVNSGKLEKECRELNSRDLSIHNPQIQKEQIVKAHSFSVNMFGYPYVCFLTIESRKNSSSPTETSFVLATLTGGVLYQFETLTGFPDCKVKAVTFDDYNGDQNSDIIVITQCVTDGRSYNDNVVYWSRVEDNRVVWGTDPEMNERISLYGTINAVKKALFSPKE